MLRSSDKKKVFELCDKSLFKIISSLHVTEVVTIGKIVHERLIKLKEKYGLDINIHYLMHPSPANPAANKGWAEIAERTLSKLNIFP